MHVNVDYAVNPELRQRRPVKGAHNVRLTPARAARRLVPPAINYSA
jgi:hypothetical protein